METDVSLAILLASAHILRKTLGPKRCRKEGIGAIIRDMRDDIAPNAIGPSVAARREAVQILESHCRLCGRCEVGRLT